MIDHDDWMADLGSVGMMQVPQTQSRPTLLPAVANSFLTSVLLALVSLAIALTLNDPKTVAMDAVAAPNTVAVD